MKLFVGLGNPGAEYAKTRHNIGFMAADAIASDHGFSSWKTKYSALIAEGRIGGEKILLMKPQTFMNKSGNAVGQAARFHKIPPEDVFVFYDELDVAPGKLKVKQGGGNGGHNGLRSIDTVLANPYWRIRLGIGHPGDKARVNGWVLGNFAKEDADWLERMLDAVSRETPMLTGPDKNLFTSKVMQSFA